ncbi:hypothetical protein FF1_003566 [Malus domestica]
MAHNRANQAHGTPNFKATNDEPEDKALLTASASERLSGEEACNPSRFSVNHQLSLKRAHNETSNNDTILEESLGEARCASRLHPYAGSISGSKSQPNRQTRPCKLRIISVVQ